MKYPGTKYVWFRRKLARIDNFFTNWGKVGTPISILSPPGWQIAKKVNTAEVQKPVKYWLIICPLFISLITVLPVSIKSEYISISIGGDLAVPFSFKLSFLSAVLLLISFAWFWLRCPPFIKSYSPQFDRLPAGLTPTNLLYEYREHALAALPRQIIFDDGRSFSRTFGGAFQPLIQPNSREDLPSSDQLVEICILHHEVSNNSQVQRFSATRFIASIPVKGFEDIYWERKELGGGLTLLKGTEEQFHDQIMLLFSPEIVVVRSEDPTINHHAKTFTALYHSIDTSRPFSRSVFWFFFIAGSICGLIVIWQIVLRGITIMLNVPTS